MRKSGRREWILWATPFVALGPLALRPVLEAWPERWRVGYSRRAEHSRWCQSNLKHLGLAFLQYAQDNDEKFPPASIGGLAVGDRLARVKRRSVSTPGAPVGWTGALIPYTRDQDIQFCPKQSPGNNQASWPRLSRSPTTRGFVDYWLNARVAGRATSTFGEPLSTFLLGEGNDGRDASNATYSRNSLPPAWLSDKSSPLWRHLDGANYLFADGHVKWLRPSQAVRFGGRSDPFAP